MFDSLKQSPRQQKVFMISMVLSALLVLLINQAPLEIKATNALSSLWTSETTTLIHNHTPQQECVVEDDTVWEEWRDCTMKREHAHRNITFYEYLAEIEQQNGKEIFPWLTDPPGAAVLLEFRPDKRKIRISINNAIDNLPVSWVVYAIGGDNFLNAVKEVFPEEVSMKKIHLMDLGFNEMEQKQVSGVLTDKNMYNQLPGKHWLFFQFDSVICKAQRHKLKYFIDQDYGWWGAPWLWGWNEHPKWCGNGGFSLRSRDFIMQVLESFELEEMTNEDGWFCRRAIDLMNQGKLHRPLAPFPEEAMFSTETVIYHKPFGIHQTWHHNRPDYQLKGLVEHCPEILSVMPGHVCNQWPQLVCEAKVDRSAFITGDNTECDWKICEKDYTKAEFYDSMYLDLYRRP